VAEVKKRTFQEMVSTIKRLTEEGRNDEAMILYGALSSGVDELERYLEPDDDDNGDSE